MPVLVLRTENGFNLRTIPFVHLCMRSVKHRRSMRDSHELTGGGKSLAKLYFVGTCAKQNVQFSAKTFLSPSPLLLDGNLSWPSNPKTRSMCVKKFFRWEKINIRLTPSFIRLDKHYLTEHSTISEPQNSSIDVSELSKSLSTRGL